MMISQKCSCLIQETCEDVTLNNKRDLADVINDLDMVTALWLIRWGQYNPKPPYKRASRRWQKQGEYFLPEALVGIQFGKHFSFSQVRTIFELLFSNTVK